MATIPSTNALNHFLMLDPLEIPGVDQPLVYTQLEAISNGIYTNARKFLAKDLARSTGLAVRGTAFDVNYATTLMSYKPDYLWRRAGASTSTHHRAGLQILGMMHGSSKYTTADVKYGSKSAINAVTRLMSGMLVPSRAQEDQLRREKVQRGTAMLVNDAEVMFGFRGLADNIPGQAMSDLASGANTYFKQQLHQLEMYRLWQDYNDFDGKAEFAGYFSGGVPDMLKALPSNLPSVGGDAIGSL